MSGIPVVTPTATRKTAFSTVSRPDLRMAFFASQEQPDQQQRQRNADEVVGDLLSTLFKARADPCTTTVRPRQIGRETGTFRDGSISR